MKLPNQCCYKCKTRYSGCHSKCAEYLAAKAELERIRKEKNKNLQINAYTAEVAKRKAEKCRKKEKL